MTKSERNNAFSKMLKEFPKVFGRVSFRERLMLGVAFDYAITETHDLENRLLGERCNQLLKDKGELTDKIADIKANCDLAIEGRDIKIKELEKENAELKQQIEKMKCCENCKYHSFWGDELKCNYGLKEALQEDKLVECNKMDKWEIRK